MTPPGNGRGNRATAAWIRRLCWLVVTLGVWVQASQAHAQALPWNDTPPQLRPWIPWVLDTQGEHMCPRVGEKPVCVWPGLMQLDLTGSMGHFRLTVVVDRRTIVDLPGSPNTWPQNVDVSGTPGIIVDRDGTPGLALARGAHVIEGDYFWNAVPETLKVPPGIALISLRRDGNAVKFPKRDPELLWLRGSSAASDEQQRLTLEVFRKLEDGVPFKVTTRLSLRVAGKARELNLGQVLLPGSSALTIESALPVRLNDDQTLSAQVYAGNHTIDIQAVFERPPGELPQTPHVEPWPAEEIWVLAANPELRQVDVTGAPAIDPNRTSLPEPWQRLAAYSVGPEAEVALVTTQRGDPESPPNRVQLQRDIWFDLDGSGYTIVDRFSGQMNRDWRLDLGEGELGRVLVDGEPQLITQNPGSGASGVELREGNLDMVAEWRVKARRSSFPAVGWSEDVQQLDATLHVPPGWELIDASGVDGLSQTWISSWDLFSLFFVLIVSAAIWQLMHLSWGLLALITMVLTHDQSGAPSVLWALIVTCIALLRVVPKGLLRRFVIATTLCGTAGLLVTLVSFTSSEVRTALFPQTAREVAHDPGMTFGLPAREAAKTEAPAIEDLERYAEEPEPAQQEIEQQQTSSMGKRPAPQKKKAVAKAPLIQKQQDPQAVVQTGPGIPTWNWRSWHLDWSGPVRQDHKLRLYLLSASGSGLISALRVLLCGFLAYLLLRYAVHQAQHPPRRKRKRPVAASSLLLGVLAALAVFTTTPESQAQIPDDELLDELRTRITRKPLCHPDCLSVQRMEVGISGDTLTIGSEVHAADEGSYQLPGPFVSWAPTDVRINGTPAAGLVLADDGFLHLRVPAGRYWVTVTGPVLGNNVTLTLGDKPRWVKVNAEEWEVDGVNATGAVEGSLRFHRLADAEQPETTSARAELPSWLLITRTLQFGANWSISTHVERLGTSGSPIVERFELLPGEQVTRADLVVEGNEAVLSLGRDETSLDFESVLEVSDEVFLVAQSQKRLSERWVVQCGPIWHCSTEGIAPNSHQTDGHWEPSFQPWPEDALKVTVVRPTPSVGQSLTVDNAKLTIRPGKRLLNAELVAAVRSSSRNTLNISLPADAEVQELLLDGKPHALQQAEGQVGVSLDPGNHRLQLSWQQPGAMGLFFRAPPVKFGSETVNLRVEMQIPEDRWLLFAPALSWGPAVLFWGYLAFIAIMGFVLGRLPHSPLSELQWILLGVGLTQVHAAVAVLVAAWFFAFAYLPRIRPHSAGLYNLTQLAMVWFTLVFLGSLFAAVYGGLLSTPDMQVSGAGSTNRLLSWYLDRSDGTLPQPWAISTSLWAWRGAMLAWSLWLAFNLLSWLRWGFGVFSRDGLWKKSPPRPAPGGAPMGYAPGFTPTPTPVHYPGAQWVVTGDAEEPISGAPPTPRSMERPAATRRDGSFSRDTDPSAGSRPSPPPKPGKEGEASTTVSDSSPQTLPTGKSRKGEPDDDGDDDVPDSTEPSADSAPSDDTTSDDTTSDGSASSEAGASPSSTEDSAEAADPTDAPGTDESNDGHASADETNASESASIDTDSHSEPDDTGGASDEADTGSPKKD